MDMTHEQLKANLRSDIGKAIVCNLTQLIYSWAHKVPATYYNYRVIEELTIRYDVGQKTRLRLDKNKHYRIDAVMFIQPGWRSLNQKQCYTVGIELKGNKLDLTQDKKFDKYLGWTDFLFFGVTNDLINDALEMAAAYDNIGVIDVEFGIIVKLPKRCQVPTDNRLWLYEQVIYNTIFADLHSVYFTADDIDIVQPELVDAGVKVQPDLLNVSNNNTIKQKGEKIKPDKFTNKTNAAARAEERKKRATEVAQMAAELPEPTRVVLSTLPDNVQQAYHVIRQNPEINAHGIEQKLSVGEATAKRFVGALIGAGLVARQGSRKTGGYIISASDSIKYTSRCRDCALLKAYNERNNNSSK